MGLKRLLGSKRTRQLSALTLLAQGGREFRRGDVKMAGAYLLAALVSYRSTALGLLSRIAVRLFGRKRPPADGA